MLKELRLTNIVLVESTTISFASSFNVLSGESGSGKSAIMNALNLIAGERCDPSYVRHGEEKGVIEAIFDITKLSEIAFILNEAGIDHEEGEELFIRREITTAGKSRAFINNQLAQLAVLRRVSSLLFEIIGQHANQKLLLLDYHRQVLDLFANLESDITAFYLNWQREIEIRGKLDELIRSESLRIREMEIARAEIEELELANLQEDEEEEIFAEYTQLTNADELAQKTEEILNVFSGEKIAVLTHLSRQKHTFEQLLKLTPSLVDAAISYENARLELHDIAQTLRNFQASIEHNPERATFLNIRLELINRIKRKYGPHIHDVQIYHQQVCEKLNRLGNADADIECLQEEVKQLAEKTEALSAALSSKRKAAANKLEAAVLKHLHSLNMPKVEFFLEITQQKRNRYGDDKIEFYITPNVGEHRVSLRECASGGELSRIMLAVQALLAGKEKIPTLVFDEIDANIGGETAVVVGEKLKEIATQHQILCITHFPQVAKLAEHHLRIIKKEINGRTITFVNQLDHAAHLEELVRMLGGQRYDKKQS